MFKILHRVVFILVTFCVMQVFADDPVFDIGHMSSITIDGEADDWGGGGLKIPIFKSMHDIPAANDFQPACRLGWNEKGLLLLAQVRDNSFVEAKGDRDIWHGDAIEFFLADKKGGKQRVQLLIAPGLDPKCPDVRVRLINNSDRKPAGVEEIQAQVARICTTNGYSLEVLLPWQVIDIQPTPGREIAVQVCFNDHDTDKSIKQLIWYPKNGSYRDTTSMHRICLAETSSPAVRAAANVTHENFRWLVVHVNAIKEMTDQTVTLFDGDRQLTSGKLIAINDQAQAILRVRVNQFKTLPPTVQVHFADDTVPCNAKLPDLTFERARTALFAPLRFTPSSVFGSTSLPICDFEQPLVMEEVLGLYTMEMKVYDAQHKLVTAAIKPGRYGAVIRITTGDGKTYTRYRTLYRMQKSAEPWNMKFEAQIQLPAEYGIDPTIAVSAQTFVNDTYHESFWNMARHADYQAALLSGLSEMKPGREHTVYNGPVTLEKQWWTEQERILNGNDKRFTQSFMLPVKTDGNATVLHAGTMAEAGMVEDAPQKVDAILQKWSADTDEAFIACVVRNGVIVLHKAYGMRDGKPMTTVTPSWMASLSKLISGSTAMMMVDQQLIDLDTPIDAYLPEMHNAGFNKTPSIRNLWMHTAGMWSHLGEENPDLEHLIAEYAPNLHVGKKYEYDGMGLELGIQLLGQVSGQCYPLMVKSHLLDPLGCEYTECQNASWNTRSTAMDMAKIGQMLLNGGAYGPYRFMSEKTRDAMLPIDLSTITTDKSPVIYGIGTHWFAGDGLSDRCFAHAAASSATLRIDLKYNLVISMTRNDAGKNFNTYHPQFIQTVTDCMVKPGSFRK